MPHTDEGGQDLAEGPWNPGIGSTLTRELPALSTAFRKENVFNGLTQAMELRDLTGLPLEELAIFRPERLALHEAIVRVTADFEVPGPESADVRSLGINFRQMVQTFLSYAIEPIRAELAQEYGSFRRALATLINEELSASFADAGPSVSLGHQGNPSRGLWRWFRGNSVRPGPPVRERDWDRDEHVLRDWSARADDSGKPLHAAALRSLVTVAAAIRSRHGRILHRHPILASLATDLACNLHGGEVVGRLVAPRIGQVAAEEGFRQLPPRAGPS